VSNPKLIINHWCDKKFSKSVAECPDYTVNRCRKCGAFFVTAVSAPPRALIKVHEDFDFTSYYDEYKNEDIDNLVDVRNLLLKHVKSGRILDVGSGIGTFISSLLDATKNFEITACEINKGCLERLTLLPVRLAACPIEDFNDNERFDAITLIHSLEHLKDPFGVIQKCNALLKENGILLIQVPAHRSPLFWKGYLTKGVKQTLLAHYNLGGHCYGFLPKTMKQLVTLNNFAVLYLRAGRYYQRYYFLIKRSGFIAKPFLRLFLKTVDFFADLWGIGGITLVCKKVTQIK
jgi:2-polyprenyl-3-methyl-5-hydroxy-6-metoxy-1,4-benzoquinol methylase